MEPTIETSAQHTHQELWETTDRAIQEIEALEAIYGRALFDETHDASSVVMPSSQEAWKEAQHVLESIHSGDLVDLENLPPEIALEIETPVELHGGAEENPSVRAKIRIRLPMGYPEYKAALITSVTAVDVTNKSTVLKRAVIDDIVASLANKAKELVGVEAVMDI
ncbi:MAG: hypothetical protein SGARI_003812, partial [Bacillariaceae sp.]